MVPCYPRRVPSGIYGIWTGYPLLSLSSLGTPTPLHPGYTRSPTTTPRAEYYRLGSGCRRGWVPWYAGSMLGYVGGVILEIPSTLVSDTIYTGFSLPGGQGWEE